MDSLERELERARRLEVRDLATTIEEIGFECTDCGACCRGSDDEEHTATVFPDEVRAIRDAGRVPDPAGNATDGESTDGTADRWVDIARPMPYGLEPAVEGPVGETFEWALQTDDCGNCVFYDETGESGGCSIYRDRPLICRTYPFSVALDGTSQPMGSMVTQRGVVRIHECEGVGRDIERADARELATTLRERAIRELEEAIAVRDEYSPPDGDDPTVVVHDSEGPKRPDGTPLE